jgi:hypothetical protein
MLLSASCLMMSFGINMDRMDDGRGLTRPERFVQIARDTLFFPLVTFLCPFFRCQHHDSLRLLHLFSTAYYGCMYFIPVRVYETANRRFTAPHLNTCYRNLFSLYSNYE